MDLRPTHRRWPYNGFEDPRQLKRELSQPGDHAVGNAVRNIVAHKLVQERKPEEDGRPRGLSGYDLAIGHDRNAGRLTAKVRYTSRVAGDLLVLENPGRGKHSRRRAYRADEAPFLLLAAQPLEKRLAKTKIFRAFPAAR